MIMKRINKTVLVFGVFDELHPGHLAFLKEAAELGDKLVIALAQDRIVLELKGREPVQMMDDRKTALEALKNVSEVIPGDNSIGTYSPVISTKPDIVAFGYDQEALREDFERFAHEQGLEVKIITLSPHKPDLHKSSLNRV